MRTGWSEQVRQFATKEYVEPARRKGESVVIPVGEISQKLRSKGFPAGHIRQICTSLESKRFRERLGLKLESPEGQPERVSTVLRFRFDDKAATGRKVSPAEDPLLMLVGSLGGAIPEGAKAFLQEMRKDQSSGESR